MLVYISSSRIELNSQKLEGNQINREDGYFIIDCLSDYPICQGCFEYQTTYEESRRCDNQILENYLSQRLEDQQDLGGDQKIYDFELNYLIDRSGRVVKESIQVKELGDDDLKKAITAAIGEIQYQPQSSRCRNGLKWFEEKEIRLEFIDDYLVSIRVKNKEAKKYKIRVDVEVYENYEEQINSLYTIYVEVDPDKNEKAVLIEKGDNLLERIENVERASGILMVSIINEKRERKIGNQKKLEWMKKIYNLDCGEHPYKKGIYLYGLNDCIRASKEE